MSISIKELISADTISEIVEKINFNFDQLLLNGGGPRGPIGAQGVKGPMGVRGERGSVWFGDTSPSPGSNPNSLIFNNLLDKDLFLQSNGDVWEYSNLVWVNTGINLKGIKGDTGNSAGFSYFGYDGNQVTRDAEVIYPSINELNITGSSDDGVPTLLAGGYSSLDNPIPGSSGNSVLTPALEETIDSTTVSFFIRQKNSSARSIVFSGGDSTEGYNLNDINALANIYLLPDDAIQINIPKLATLTGSNLVGYNLNTFGTSQLFQSGRSIRFSSGNYAGPVSSPYTGNSNNIADIIFDVEDLSSAGNLEESPGIKFNVKYATNSASFILGPSSSIPSTSTKTGSAFLDANIITLLAKNSISQISPSISLTATTSITNTAPTINQNGNIVNIGIGSAAAIQVKNDSNNSIRLKGAVTWGRTTYQNPNANNLWNLVGTGHTTEEAVIKLTNDSSNNSFLLSLTGQSNQVNLYADRLEVTTINGSNKKIIASVNELASNEVNLRTGMTQSYDERFFNFRPQYGVTSWNYDSTLGSYSLQSPDKSYWEFLIGQNGLAPGNVVSSWSSTLNLDIPDGTHKGQILYLKVVVLPTYLSIGFPTPTIYEYTPTVQVRLKTYTSSYETISTLTCDPTDPNGSETMIHAIWTDDSMSSSYNGGQIVSSGNWRILSITDKINFKYNT